MNQKSFMNLNIKMDTGKLQTIITVLFCFLFVSGLCAEIKNTSKPIKGKSLFNIKKVWSTDTAGEDPFGNIDDILISAKGTICCYDNKNMKYYLFDGCGQFIQAFGSRGEGPGQIKQLEEAPILKAGNKIVVQDVDRLHYFSWEGKYIRSVLNPVGRMPNLFLNENKFIHAPLTILNAPDGIAKVRQIDLASGKEKILTEFTMFKGGTLQTRRGSASMWVDGLTPMFILGKIGNKLYYGVNDKYKVYISDMHGKVQGSFSLNRKKTSVSEKEKVDFISRAAQGQAPDDLIRKLAKQLPNQETYFSFIEEHNSLIYLYVSKFIIKNTQPIDIFSPKGEYLYEKNIKIKPGYNMVCRPVIDRGYVYLTIEDEDGEITVSKYEIKLPQG